LKNTREARTQLAGDPERFMFLQYVAKLQELLSDLEASNR
jgi:hypothetical protein